MVYPELSPKMALRAGFRVFSPWGWSASIAHQDTPVNLGYNAPHWAERLIFRALARNEREHDEYRQQYDQHRKLVAEDGIIPLFPKWERN
jgi:hypothetical protein